MIRGWIREMLPVKIGIEIEKQWKKLTGDRILSNYSVTKEGSLKRD